MDPSLNAENSVPGACPSTSSDSDKGWKLLGLEDFPSGARISPV